MIALDWGLSSFRAFRLAPDGRVVDQRSAAAGILTIAPGAFEATLIEQLGDWRDDRPIVAAGMVGSRQGWVEAPYAPCPAGAAELAAALLRHPTAQAGDVWLVPGVRWSDDATVDVMRGEEAQIVGALAARGVADAVLCLPGTHAKWALAAGGRIVRFRTYMTGEVFAVLRQHSILGRLMRDDVDDDDTFDQGLARAAAPGGLLHHLFSARAAGLFARIAEPHLASYLSGLLIGDEIASALATVPADAPILLVGAPALCRRYARALTSAGRVADVLPETVGARGIHAIARAAGLLG
ncbi:MAG: 2-dehydro-3-deoxygalactonokinase [Proteobacteria bacterium]|nr:2-dehydro-3-deoxygalactonokinase [Pseudomonadota bacterium]